MLDLQFPRFDFLVQEQGSVGYTYLFLISTQTPVISDAVMMQLGPPRGVPLLDYPPEDAFIAAGLSVLANMRDLLARGVEAVVEDQMTRERRFKRSDTQEKVVMARQALATAKAIGARGLEDAQRQLEDRLRTLARRKRPGKARKAR